MARVLIVDDEADIREVVSEALAFEGHEVLTAADGIAALRACYAHSPDLVLLDLMMPGMTGWQFRAAQLSDPAIAGIPVVVVSALGRDTRIDATGFLPKPFSLEALVEVVRQAARPGHAAHAAL